ncbi:NnrS family protein [Aquibium sp. LZ166]|uniref:NnrS family protein n=1 Tax=Aquibium pacificus TaxID=3153579 RepID=A0ABV3SIY1_9HYPH
MPAILHYGFRPFFFLGASYAAIALPIWLWIYTSGGVLGGPFEGMAWHAHEMVFGYLGAVIAGFVLTAVPNWTGRLPLSGLPLLGLVSLWLIGRIGCAFVTSPAVAMGMDLAFPIVLAASVWREVAAGGNWRNAPVAGMLTLLALSNLAHHLEAVGTLPDGYAIRIALGTVAMLITLIGGRIVPSFTRNWLVKQGPTSLPAQFGILDKAALASTALAVISWMFAAETAVSSWLLMTSGTLLAVRVARWQGWQTWREPIVLVLHLGYAWLAVSMLLLGLSTVTEVVPTSAAVHALTAGAIGTMTLAVMTRASLGHTGRQMKADLWTQAIYVAVTVGALLRVAAPFATDTYLTLLMAGGILWTFAFALFAARYAPILWRYRK